jgi:hypothetical protein
VGLNVFRKTEERKFQAQTTVGEASYFILNGQQGAHGQNDTEAVASCGKMTHMSSLHCSIFIIIPSVLLSGFIYKLQCIYYHRHATFTLSPDSGPVTGTCGGSLNSETKTFSTSAVLGDCTVIASFYQDDRHKT